MCALCMQMATSCTSEKDIQGILGEDGDGNEMTQYFLSENKRKKMRQCNGKRNITEENEKTYSCKCCQRRNFPQGD